MKIYKQIIHPVANSLIKVTLKGYVPLGIVDIQLQGGECVLWYWNDADAGEDTEKLLYVAFTGFEVKAHITKHIKTIQDSIGLVWHFFEAVPEEVE